MDLCKIGEFAYCFGTIYMASIWLGAKFSILEAKYEDWKNPESTELIFLYWIPIINTSLLIMFYANFLYSVYILKHQMLKKAKKILRENEGDDIINKYF